MVFFNYAQRKLNAKIVYYGPGLCGKTTNLQWIHDHFEGGDRGKMLSLATEGDRTIFFDLLPLDIGSIRGMDVTLQLYTVPGQVHYNSTRQLVLKGADGVVFVADSQRAMLESNVESWGNLKDNLVLQGATLEEFPHVLQFNKRDLDDIAPVDELDEALNEYSRPFFESVAIHGIGVQETLEGVLKLVMRNLRDRYEGRPRTGFRPKGPASTDWTPEDEGPRKPQAPSVPKPASVSVSAADPPVESTPDAEETAGPDEDTHGGVTVDELSERARRRAEEATREPTLVADEGDIAGPEQPGGQELDASLIDTSEGWEPRKKPAEELPVDEPGSDEVPLEEPTSEEPLFGDEAPAAEPAVAGQDEAPARDEGAESPLEREPAPFGAEPVEPAERPAELESPLGEEPKRETDPTLTVGADQEPGEPFEPPEAPQERPPAPVEATPVDTFEEPEEPESEPAEETPPAEGEGTVEPTVEEPPGEPAISEPEPEPQPYVPHAAVEAPEAPAPAASAVAPFQVWDGEPFENAGLTAEPSVTPVEAQAVEIAPGGNQLRLKLEGSGALAESGQVRELDVEVPVPGGWIGGQRVTMQLRLTLTPAPEDR